MCIVPPRCKRYVRGVTFVEVIVSVLILGVALSGMLGTFVIGRVNIVKARHRLEVAYLLQQTMEYLQDTDYENIADSSESVTIDNAGTVDTSSDDLTGVRSIVVSTIAGAGGLYKSVTVKLVWTERSWGGEGGVSEELITYFRKE